CLNLLAQDTNNDICWCGLTRRPFVRSRREGETPVKEPGLPPGLSSDDQVSVCLWRELRE
ncbi:unnamed protein product, partial [Linum tenue]